MRTIVCEHGNESGDCKSCGDRQRAANLYIDVADVPWDRTGGKAHMCADCGFDFDTHEEGEEGETQVPLQIFRDNGKGGMITLCWNCARLRMQRKGLN